MNVFNSILNIFRFNKGNWKAVAFCLFAATVFWFLNALNKTYTANINFPLAFDYDKDNYIPVSSLPEEVRLNVTGNGWDLFKRSVGVKVPSLEIPLERPAETRKIVGNMLPVFFSNQLEGLQINYILTDTLYLDIDKRSSRWINLTMDSAIHLMEGYGLTSEVSIEPDSIFLEGPQRIINSFKNPVHLRLRQRNIDENFKEDVEIEIPSSELVKRNPPTVDVTFNVERLIEYKDSLELKLINIPETVSSVMNAGKIPVTLAIPESKTKTFQADSARAVLNLEGFVKGKEKILPTVTGLPPYSKIVAIDSVTVTL